MKRVLPAIALLSLGACGSTHSLKPPQGEALPPKPYGATATPTAEDLFDPPTQARPSRTIDVLIRSQEREGDEYDLPPN